MIDLKKAIHRGDVNHIYEFFHNGGDINAYICAKMTPLMYAIKYDYGRADNNHITSENADERLNHPMISDEKITVIILSLIMVGADVNICDSDKAPLLCALCMKRDYVVVYQLLYAGSDLGATEKSSGKTVLMLAVENNYSKDFVQELLNNGADINIRDNQLVSPLQYALINQNLELIELFMNNGSNFFCPVYTYEPYFKINRPYPPHIRFNQFYSQHRKNCVINNQESCSIDGCKNKKIWDFFLKKGLCYKETYGSSRSSFLHVVNCCYAIKSAVKSGVSLYSVDGSKCSVMEKFFKLQNFDKVRYLLELGFNPNCAATYLVGNRSNKQKMSTLNMVFYFGADFYLEYNRNKAISGFDLHRKLRYLSEGNLSYFLIYYLKNFLLFINTDGLCNIFTDSSDSSTKLFVDCCKRELQMMSNMYIVPGLSLYRFCSLKLLYHSEFIDISRNDSTLGISEIKEFFPIYHDLIIMRINDNNFTRVKKVMLNCVLKISIKPLSCFNSFLNVELPYDCKHEISRYLNYKDLYNLFLSAI